jgi:hypothetical protein
VFTVESNETVLTIFNPEFALETILRIP